MSNSHKKPFTQITEAELIKVFEEIFKDSKDVFPEYYYTNNNVKMVKIDGVFVRASAFDKAMKEVLEEGYLETLGERNVSASISLTTGESVLLEDVMSGKITENVPRSVKDIIDKVFKSP